MPIFQIEIPIFLKTLHESPCWANYVNWVKLYSYKIKHVPT